GTVGSRGGPRGGQGEGAGGCHCGNDHAGTGRRPIGREARARRQTARSRQSAQRRIRSCAKTEGSQGALAAEKGAAEQTAGPVTKSWKISGIGVDRNELQS